MTTAEILQALERYNGKFPETAMRAAVEQREAITPELLRALQAVADDAPRYAEQENYMLHMFGLYLLAQFREKRAYPLLIKLISWPGDTVDCLLGDTITEGLPGLLASVFDGNHEALVQVALNEQAYPFVRSSATDALVLLYLENLITREQILEAFRRLYRELKEEGDPQPWNGLVDATADAGLSELLPELREVCRKGPGEGLYGELDFFEAKLTRPRAEVVAKFKYHRHLVQDAIAEMSWWAAFEPEKGPAKADKERKAKIGRNDPCPCGSGKKYKKCCLGKTEA